MYGQPTSNYEYVKMLLKEKLSKEGVEVSINEISDWTKIVENKVQSLPTITVNDHISMSYTDDQNINEFIQELADKILQEDNQRKMKNIIVPTDFSNTATNALIYAKAISKKLNGTVQLVHVYKPQVVQVDNAVIIDEKLERVRRKELDRFVTNINQSWAGDDSDDLPIDGIFKVGFVAEEISHLCAHHPEESLVVVGSTGSSGTLKRLFGSVTTKLAKTLKNPILIIPPDVTFQKVTNILFAVDDIKKDIKAITKVLSYAATLDASVHLVHVKTDDELYPEQEIKAIAKDAYPDVKVYFASIDGPDVAESIRDYAATNTIDIVSVVTHERGFFAELFLAGQGFGFNSVTKKLAITTDTPLLVFHA